MESREGVIVMADAGALHVHVDLHLSSCWRRFGEDLERRFAVSTVDYRECVSGLSPVVRSGAHDTQSGRFQDSTPRHPGGAMHFS
jgi:hypothetical protein